MIPGQPIRSAVEERQSAVFDPEADRLCGVRRYEQRDWNATAIGYCGQLLRDQARRTCVVDEFPDRKAVLYVGRCQTTSADTYKVRLAPALSHRPTQELPSHTRNCPGVARVLIILIGK